MGSFTAGKTDVRQSSPLTRCLFAYQGYVVNQDSYSSYYVLCEVMQSFARPFLSLLRSEKSRRLFVDVHAMVEECAGQEKWVSQGD